jgi:hypothetical protein
LAVVIIVTIGAGGRFSRWELHRHSLKFSLDGLS